MQRCHIVQQRQLIILSAVVASAAAAIYGGRHSNHAGYYGKGGSVDYHSVPDYSHGYAVADPYSGVDNTAEETRLGDRTEGSYSTVLPDGRKQIVTYWVDGDSGYNAKVTYEGVAHHPETPIKKQPQTPVIPHHETPIIRLPDTLIIPPLETPYIQHPQTPFIQRPLTANVPHPATPIIQHPRIPRILNFDRNGQILGGRVGAGVGRPVFEDRLRGGVGGFALGDRLAGGVGGSTLGGHLAGGVGRAALGGRLGGVRGSHRNGGSVDYNSVPDYSYADVQYAGVARHPVPPVSSGSRGRTDIGLNSGFAGAASGTGYGPIDNYDVTGAGRFGYPGEIFDFPGQNYDYQGQNYNY